MNERYYLELLLMAEKNCIDEYVKETLSFKYNNFYNGRKSLDSSFDWSKSNRGFCFWFRIYDEAFKLIEAQNEN